MTGEAVIAGTIILVEVLGIFCVVLWRVLRRMEKGDEVILELARELRLRQIADRDPQSARIQSQADRTEQLTQQRKQAEISQTLKAIRDHTRTPTREWTDKTGGFRRRTIPADTVAPPPEMPHTTAQEHKEESKRRDDGA